MLQGWFSRGPSPPRRAPWRRLSRSALSIPGHELVECRAARRKFFERDAVQRRFSSAVEIMELGRVRFIDVDEPRHVFVVLELGLDVVVRGGAIRGIVGRIELPQYD